MYVQKCQQRTLSSGTTDILDSLFRGVLHAFCEVTLQTYLNVRLSVFPCNHTKKVLLNIVSTENVVSSPLSAWYLTLYFALHISCNLAEV
jgi:hypothetical protein